MSTLRPRTPCVISKKTGGFDMYGRETHRIRRTKTKCSIVNLYNETEKTSVRADSSASRGRADEQVADVRVLLRPKEKISTGDLIEITLQGGDPIVMQVNRIFRRPDIDGAIHHIDVEGDLWVSE